MNIYSAIHKAGGFTAPGRSMILPGTFLGTSISRELVAGMAPVGGSNR